MPAADDHHEYPTLTPDELLGGMAYYAATSAPDGDDMDLDRELAQLLADDGHRRPVRGITPHDPLPGC